jgi:hypothetical protein
MSQAVSEPVYISPTGSFLGITQRMAENWKRVMGFFHGSAPPVRIQHQVTGGVYIPGDAGVGKRVKNLARGQIRGDIV